MELRTAPAGSSSAAVSRAKRSIEVAWIEAGRSLAHFLHANLRRGPLVRQTMDRTDTPPKLREASRQIDPAEVTSELYEGLDLAANAEVSLLTWDVSAHARREQDRLTSAYRPPKDVQGGY
jgi:hypothetical protein